MKHLDLTLPSPAENLACDEALLDWREENGGEEILRFWESSETFAVVGYANKIATEVNTSPHARQKEIPILRRCSGGGTVLHGAGCLNYAIILLITEDGPAAQHFTSANKFIMERNRTAIETLAQIQTRNFNSRPYRSCYWRIKVFRQLATPEKKLPALSRNISFELRPRARQRSFANAIETAGLSPKSQPRRISHQLESFGGQSESCIEKIMERD